MYNFKKLEKKWQKKWAEDKIFEADSSNKKKFFVNAPYPYINAYLHVGHLYTYMRAEAFARYKRLKGYNVLFPQGWHATGAPIINAANRVKEGEPKQIKIMKDMGFSDDEIKNFKNPEYWLKFFAPEFEKDFKYFGMSIDWRRSFHTTSINPYYDKFVKWQFRKLKEKGYCIQGKFPVVWCPKCNTAVSDHARSEGEGETPKDFIWVKFRMQDSDLIAISGTTRPDALYGQSNLWIDPKGDYVVVDVAGEKWVVGKEIIEKIKDQFNKKPKIIRKISPKELIGKWYKGPLVDRKIYSLPAWFIDSSIGSGIVYSALEDPVDLYELEKIQTDPELRKKYNLEEKVVMKLKPIPIIDVPGMGENLGKEIGEEFDVKSAEDIKKLEKAKGELNKRVFRKGIMKKTCGQCAGMTVPDAQEYLKKILIEDKDAIMFYELSNKVVCRCLTECIIKMVEDQWFIDYSNKKWKKTVHQCLDSMKLYPDKTRQQFDYTIDWLHQWACTREEGLGTRLPWDEKWLIESLSDSTIYMAYYTFVHILETIPIEEIDDKLFDYIMLEKWEESDFEIDNKKLKRMKEEFEYWYPFDFRNSAKDLIQNHLTFCIFNHTAIFPKKFWPKGFGLNGWVRVDGQKMSKSLGNMIPLREMGDKFGIDASRVTILSGGEDMDDPNWDSKFAELLNSRFEQLTNFINENYGKGKTEIKEIDKWMSSKINEIIKEAEGFMEQTFFRSAIQLIYFEMQRALKWYFRRTNNAPNKEVIDKYIESQLIMFSVFAPHLCEELWEKIGKKTYISIETWPKADKIDKTFNYKEELIENIITDIHQVFKLAKIEKPENINLFIAAKWKYDLFELVNEILKKTQNPGEILKKVMKEKEFQKYGKEISKFLPKMINSRKVPVVSLTNKQESFILNEAINFFKREFACEINIIDSEKSIEQKAKQAMPSKPAILVK